MAELVSPAELEDIKKILGLSHLEVVLRSNWGSENTGYREEIHGELKKRMAKAYPFSDSSISHTRQMGGFAMTGYSESSQLLGLGFDIEEDSRVAEPIAR